MAERRMFAKSIVLSDAFLDMPLSARCLYFTLGMLAGNKGYLYGVKVAMRMSGNDDKDLQMLLDNGYLRKIEDGYEIAHWYENNGVGETAKKRLTYPYQQWRKKILKRDKVCQHCGSAEMLEVHHIKHFAEYPELRMCDENAITLCYKCHKELHRRERDGKKKNV